MTTRVSDKPVGDIAPKDFAARMAIASHPAFRLGFLDAQRGKPIDHDHIMDRIDSETPATALRRIGWKRREALPLFDNERALSQTALAQYRYEEGRLCVMQLGLKCKAWGHPDYPPKQVVDLCWTGVPA